MASCRLSVVIVIVIEIALWTTQATWSSYAHGLGPTGAVVAPVGTTVTFTCVVNTTELPVGTSLFGFGWIVNHAKLSGSSDQESTDGSLEISTLQLPVIQDYVAGVLVQCQVALQVSGSDTLPLMNNNATLTAYGPPEAPSNLTSTQSSTGNALILSWSAPSSPVQLHYTVTVNTSTTAITVTNDTNITITREQVMAAINSSECDLYTFSVTAINPAGSSIPANLTTPVTFVPDPKDAQYNVCMSSDNSTIISFQALDGYQYSITNESECSSTISSITNGLTVFQIPYPHNCTVLTVLAEHNCTEGLIPVNISNVTAQCPVQPSPSTSAIIPSSSTSAIFITTAVSTSSSPTTVAPPGPNIQIIVPAAVVLLLVAVTVVIAIIVLLVIVRKRNRKDSMVKPASASVLTEDTEFKDEETKTSYKEEKSILPQQNKQPLPEYMVPADAVKLYKQNGNTSTLKAPQQTPCVVQQPPAAEYATPSVQHHTQQQVQDMPLYSDVFGTQKGNSLRSSQRKNNTFDNKTHAAPSLPPPPPTATDEYSSLQHDLGGGGGPHQVVDQDQHVYDSAQGDLPQYSSIQQPKKTKYADVQFSPDTGLQIRGNTSSTVQYSVVGDTTNMEYSVVGPKTVSSQDCPPSPPPPPSAEVVQDMMDS